MGYTSVTCAVTGIPILATAKTNHRHYVAVTVVYPDGTTISGDYDGYERVDRVDLRDVWPDNGQWDSEVKIVLTAFYQGETYAQLGRSYRDPSQGYFIALADVQRFHTEAHRRGKAFESGKAYQDWYTRQR